MTKKIIAFMIAAAAVIGAYCYEVTAYKVGEFTDSERGVKVCVYEYFGEKYFSAVGTYKMCPYSIKVCKH